MWCCWSPHLFFELTVLPPNTINSLQATLTNEALEAFNSRVVPDYREELLQLFKYDSHSSRSIDSLIH